jgi:hypothetical protein
LTLRPGGGDSARTGDAWHAAVVTLALAGCGHECTLAGCGHIGDVELR